LRYALGLEYDGCAFLGWQIQRQEPTVQGCVEKALARVHAICQVAHFDTDAVRTERSWVLGLNSHLPPGAAALWIRRVDEDFHARFSAYSRSYRYQILNRWIRPALEARRQSWCRQPLKVEHMHEAAQSLLGEHDFSSFRASACQARHAIREIQAISVTREGDTVNLEVTANGFLYHMVRNIAGSLIRIGCGEAPVEWLGEVLRGRDRTRAAPTAAPEGLYLLGARYPEKYDLPTATPAFAAGWDLS
jgi:tRNA pseudouridine38-40 synthase